MSDPSEQPPEARGETRPKSPRPKKPSVSPPAFAAVLLVLAIGGGLAWLALSADKSDEPARDDVNATLTVELEGEIPEAPKAPEADSQAPESEETKTAAAPEPAVVASVEEAAAP
ncbi:MAG: hypothetical protein CFH39_01686, partial [Alphaproteobacteria bacterium MarineAlpha10_Bin2]